MQYVKLNLVQSEQRRPVEGRVGEEVAVHLAKGGVQQVPYEKVPFEYQEVERAHLPSACAVTIPKVVLPRTTI